MSKKIFIIYLFASLIQIVLIVAWMIVFQNDFAEPVYSGLLTMASSHLFFWFGSYAPRLTLLIAKENGKLKEQMNIMKMISFGWLIMFGIGAIWMLAAPLINNNIENIIFSFIPASMSAGAYICWKYIDVTQADKGNI